MSLDRDLLAAIDRQAADGATRSEVVTATATSVSAAAGSLRAELEN